jgi:hypothetical protein
MTARQPRRTRRRAAPANSLPRPIPGTETSTSLDRGRAARAAPHHREHHVKTDYSYVRKDIVAITAIASVVMAFVVATSFLF